MKFGEVQKVFDRINRIQSRLKSIGGEGFEWSFTHPEFGYQEYSIQGLKTPEELQDDIENALIWLWNLKDYIKKFAESKNMPGKWVEEQIGNSKNLCLCADIANTLKHGGLDRSSRTGNSPILGSVKYKMPLDSLNSIRFLANRVETDVADPSKVEVSLSIYDGAKNNLGDAINLLQTSLEDWEKILDKAQE